MLMMRTMYVFPGVKWNFAFWVSFNRMLSGNGGLNSTLVTLSSSVISAGTSSWYQSEVVRMISSSYCPA